MPSASVTPGNTMQQASVTLSSAQLLAIFTTPVTIVPALGAGIVAVPVVATFNYHNGGTAYTDGGGLLLVAWPGAQSGVSVTTAGFWDQTQSTFADGSANRAAIPIATVANQAIVARQSVANPTLGNGTVAITVSYVTMAVT